MIRWICPNCGRILAGCPDRKGMLGCTCPQCGTYMVMTHNTRRMYQLTWYVVY